MLGDIITHINHLWRSAEELTQITIIDDGFSEMLKWRSDASIDKVAFPTVLPLSVDSFDLVLIRSCKAKRILFCISFVSPDILRKLKQILKISGATEVIVVMSLSPDAFKVLVDASKVQLQFLQGSEIESSIDRSYDWLRQFLKPECNEVVYYPVHSFPLLSPMKSSKLQPLSAERSVTQCELLNITSPACRDLNPLTLHGLDMWNTSTQIHHITDVPAADIPLRDSSKLKGFVHELAGTLLFDLGLDPSASIFALGYTSSLIGRNLQQLLGGISKTRSSLLKTKRVQTSCDGTETLLPASITATVHSITTNTPAAEPVIENLFMPKPVSNSLFPLPPKSLGPTPRDPSGAEGSKYASVNSSLDALQTASLLLIDRTQDLSTPTTHSGEASKEPNTATPPLAHRILCTLSRGRQSNKDTFTYDIRPLPPFNSPDASAAAAAVSSSSSSSSSSSIRGAEKAFESDVDRLYKPFPAVSALSLQLSMSLCLPLSNVPPSSSTANAPSSRTLGANSDYTDLDDEIGQLRHALFAGTEEEGRQLLCAALSSRIKLFNGVVPASKRGRGLGAEVLALVQALIASPGQGSLGGSKWGGAVSPVSVSGGDRTELSSEPSSTLGFTPATCLSTQGLLSLAMLVAEAMQRSSRKQFTQHAGPCSVWLSSCEARAAVEGDVSRLLRGGGHLADLILHLTATLQRTDAVVYSAPPSPAVSRNTPPSRSGTPTLTGASGKSIASEAESTSADVVHILMQLIRVISSLGVGSANDKDKDKSRRETDHSEERASSSSRGRGNDLFSSDDFSHLRKPGKEKDVPSTLRSADDKSVALSALSGFMSALQSHLMLRSPPGELEYLCKLGLVPKYLIRDIIAARALTRTQNQVQGPGGESGKEAIRLDMEFSEFIEGLTNRFVELGSLSSVPSHTGAATSSHNERHSTGSHESSLDRDPTRGDALGLVAQSVQSFLRHRQHQVESSQSGSATGSTGGRPVGGSGIGIGGFLSSSLLNGPAPRTSDQRERERLSEDQNDLLSTFEKIESPLQVMKRAGLDLLTTGWGRLGFQSGSQGASGGAARERESSYESVLVVCIVGGISYVEVAQVQSVLSQHAATVTRNGGSEVLSRVVLVSTSAVGPEDVLNFVSQRA